MRKSIPFKIELTGQAAEPAEEKLLLLIKVMRTIANDLEIKVEFPAVIHLDDLHPEPVEGLDVEEPEKSPHTPKGCAKREGGYGRSGPERPSL